MPVLPRDPIQNSQVRNNISPVSQNRVSGADPMADQLSNTGAALNEYATKVRISHIEAEVAKAQIENEDLLSREYRALERDTNADPATLESRFAEASKKVLANTGANMSSPMHKRLWEAKAQETVMRYGQKTRELVRVREIDGAKAKTMGVLDAFLKLASDPESDPTVLENARVEASALGRAQLENGLLTKDGAEEYALKIQAGVEAGTSIRNIATIEGLMDAGDSISLAKASLLLEDAEFRAGIMPEQRAKLDDVFEAKARANTVIDKSDELMNLAKDDYGAALKMARDIENKDLRIGVEQRIGGMKSQNDAAETATENEASNEAWNLIAKGRSYASIPSSVQANIPGTTKIAMQNHEIAKAARAAAQSAEGKIKTDRAVYSEIANLIGKEDFVGAQKYLSENQNRISDADLEQWSFMANKGDPKQAESTRTLDAAAVQALRNAGIVLDGDKGAATKGGILQTYDAMQRDYVRENGKEPSDDWRDETLEALSVKVKLKNPGDWWAGKSTPRGQITEVGVIPKEHVQAALAAFPDQGVLQSADVEATYKVAFNAIVAQNGQMMGETAFDMSRTAGENLQTAMYRAAMANFSASGINPTPSEVTEMMAAVRQQAQQTANDPAMSMDAKDMAPMGVSGDMIDGLSGAANSAAEAGAGYVAERLRTAELPPRPFDRMREAEVSREQLAQDARDLDTMREKDLLWQRHGYTRYGGRKMTAEELAAAKGKGAK